MSKGNMPLEFEGHEGNGCMGLLNFDQTQTVLQELKYLQLRRS